MRNQILKIINAYPKHYSRIIKKDLEIMNWINENTQTPDVSFAEKVYTSIYPIPVCKNGNQFKFKNFFQGYIYCNHSSKCPCNKIKSAQKTSETKNSQSVFEKKLIQEKREKTMVERFGVSFSFQRPEVIKKISKPKISNDALDKLSSFDWLNDQYNIQKKSLTDIANDLNIYYGTVGEYCKKMDFVIRKRSTYSVIEREIGEFIKSLGFKIITNDWETLGNFEIDILIPDVNLGIEVNGLYWHSYNQDNDNIYSSQKHIKKKQECSKQNIDLIHLTDYEWLTQQEKVKALLKSRLKLNEKIWARKCTVGEIDIIISKKFLNDYHFQNNINSKKQWGLWYQNELIQLITFGTPRYNKKYEYELLRQCTRPGITVVGGFSKLIKYIPGSCISYCDYDKFNGNGYIAAGFNMLRNTGPGYFWTDGNLIISRYKTQKQELKKWLTSFDPIKTQDENMFAAGYRKFWTSGQLVMVKEKPGE